MKTRAFYHNNLFSLVFFALPVLFLLVLQTGCTETTEQSDESEVQQEEVSSPFSATLVEDVINNKRRTGDMSMEYPNTVDAVTRSRRNAITNAVENASPAVVSITVTEVVDGRGTMQDEFFRYFFGIPREFTNMGSGFIISEDGLVVTNQHVVGKNAKEIMVATIDGTTYEANLIGGDELTDLALLKIESDSDEPFPFVEFSDSEQVIVGEWAIALGNPFGLFEDGQPAVTVGVVSAKNRDFRSDPNNPRVYMDMIQTDAAINRGNSGGPLLNSQGNVIGVNTFIFTSGYSDGFIGLGFAIPSNRAERIINQLLSGDEITLDYDPGMDFTAMNEQLVRRYQLPAIQGLLVTSVNKSGPAFECGVMPGDIILKIGNERVLSEMHAWALMNEYYEGDTMMLELLRDGQEYETEMLLRKRVKADESVE